MKSERAAFIGQFNMDPVVTAEAIISLKAEIPTPAIDSRLSERVRRYGDKSDIFPLIAAGVPPEFISI